VNGTLLSFISRYMDSSLSALGLSPSSTPLPFQSAFLSLIRSSIIA